MSAVPQLGFDSLVNQLAHEVAQVQRQLALTQQKLGAAHRSLEMRMQELTEARGAITLLRATMDQSPDGILAVGWFGRTVHFNSRFADIWDIPGEKIELLDDSALLALQMVRVKDPVAFLAFNEAVQACPERQHRGVVELADGRAFQCDVTPQYLRGRKLGRITCLREVSGTRPIPASRR